MAASKIKLRSRDRDILFKKEYAQLKIKVALNWFEIFALLIVSFLATLKTSTHLKIGSISLSVLISLIVAIGIAFVFSMFRKYQLKITRFDKEHIYKKISNDLIDKTKKEE